MIQAVSKNIQHAAPQTLPSERLVEGEARVEPGTEDSNLKEFLAQITRFCGAGALLAYWHDAEGRNHLFSSLTFRPLSLEDAAAIEGEAIAAASRTGTVRVAMKGHHTVIGDLSTVGVLVLDEGIVTLAALPQRTSGTSADRLRSSLEQLLPLLAPYFEQWLATQRLQVRLNSFTGAIDGSGIATFLLGNDCRIIYANNAAEALLTEGDGLRRNNDRLSCAGFRDTMCLQTAIGTLSAHVDDGASPKPVLSLPRAKRRALTVVLITTRELTAIITDDVQVIGYVFDPEQDMTAMIKPVCQLHELSQSETRLTCAIVSGSSIAEAAQQVGVREQTARSYLKQIFAKTETNRQAELVQLMLKSAVRLSRASQTGALPKIC